MAYLYYAEGRYSEAEPLNIQALEMAKKLLGDEHPHTQILRDNLEQCSVAKELIEEQTS